MQSTYQKLLQLMEIWQSSGRNNFAQFFLRHRVDFLSGFLINLIEQANKTFPSWTTWVSFKRRPILMLPFVKTLKLKNSHTSTCQNFDELDLFYIYAEKIMVCTHTLIIHIHCNIYPTSFSTRRRPSLNNKSVHASILYFIEEKIFVSAA